MKRKNTPQGDLPTQSDPVLFVDPTNRTITLHNENLKFINHPQFAPYMYAFESIDHAFKQGEFEHFGLKEWKDVEKILQPARLPQSILKFIKDNHSEEEKNSLDNIYTSPIDMVFPSLKPFICVVDGCSYSEFEYSWFARRGSSPLNRSPVNLPDDLIRDSFAEATLDSYYFGVKDLKKIFSSWRQPPIQLYDISALNISPFLGYDYFVFFCIGSLIINYSQMTQVDFSSPPYLMASFFIAMEKLRKLQDIFWWRPPDEKGETSIDPNAKFYVFSQFIIILLCLKFSGKILFFFSKLLSQESLDPFAIMMCSILEIPAECIMLLPHIKAWETFFYKRENILADVRKLFSGLVNLSNKTKTLIAIFAPGILPIIIFSSRFPNSIKSFYEFDFTSCSIAIAPTFILPMLDYTVKQIEKGSRRHESKPTALQTSKKFLWNFIIMISAFVLTLTETKDPLCALSTAILMAFSINIENCIKKYNTNNNRYILCPLNNEKNFRKYKKSEYC